jgi:hypothetical protein
VELRVHPQEDDLGDRALQPRAAVEQRASHRFDLHALGAHGDAHALACPMAGADGHDEALRLSEPHHRVDADELVDPQLERVEGADEVGHEGRVRPLVDLARGADLLDVAAVHDGDPV